jgi:glycosyltransferase involved in cell wall biosynthesis
MSDKIKVMMTTEGTYPFHNGGVSVWCDLLMKNLHDDIDFVVYSIMMNPYITQKFDLPRNAELIKVPLWGTEEPSEHLKTPFSKIYKASKITTDTVIKEKFIPLFIEMIEEILNYEKNPERFGKVLHELYKYFQKYDYKKSFKCEMTWNTYKEIILKYSKTEDSKIHYPGSYSLINSLGWIYRFMTILNTPIPEVDVTHSAAAAFCGIPCVLAKFEYNAPFILTEHGVYLREQYLSLSKRGYSSFLNTFLIRMIHSIVNLNYFYADQVSPVCEYNTRWEQEFGISRDKIKVIYNGVDKSFMLDKGEIVKRTNPTVVSVARIDPIKDITTLLKAAAIVKKQVPDVKFLVYGSITVQEYYEECLKLKEELDLGESFTFVGHTTDVAKAYHSGDLVVLSSISEAFPYSVVEAMMSGKPVIATDVGGIKEAIGDAGIVVTPRNPGKLAIAISRLLLDNGLRATLSEEAKERALSLFTVKRFQELYFKSYLKLVLEGRHVSTNSTEIVGTTVARRNQRLLLEKGLSLLEYGYLEEAIVQFKAAVQQDYESSAVPFILTKIAETYNELGSYENSFNEIKRTEAMIVKKTIRRV